MKTHKKVIVLICLILILALIFTIVRIYAKYLSDASRKH